MPDTPAFFDIIPSSFAVLDKIKDFVYSKGLPRLLLKPLTLLQNSLLLCQPEFFSESANQDTASIGRIDWRAAQELTAQEL